MSSDEQALEEGKMLDSLRAARKELVAINSRSRHLAATLLAVGNALQHGRFDAPELSTNISQLPIQEELQQLVSEARVAQSTIKATLQELAQTGIEIK